MIDPEDQEFMDEIIEYLDEQVKTGFPDLSAVVDDALDIFDDGRGIDHLREPTEQALKEAIARQLEDQKTWPETTDCDRLDAAFAELEKQGVVCRSNFSSTTITAAEAIDDEIEAEQAKGRNVVGYTSYTFQCVEAAVEGDGIWLNYGAIPRDDASVQMGHRIADVIRAHGLEVEWNGELRTRIHVQLDWKRRLPESL